MRDEAMMHTDRIYAAMSKTQAGIHDQAIGINLRKSSSAPVGARVILAALLSAQHETRQRRCSAGYRTELGAAGWAFLVARIDMKLKRFMAPDEDRGCLQRPKDA